MTLTTVIGRHVLAATMAIALGSHAMAGDADRDLAALAAAWDDAFNSGDAAGVASMYAEDGRVITGDGNVKVGRDEIQALFQSFIDSGFGKHQIGVMTAEKSGDLGYLTGTWSGVGGDGNDYGGHLTNVYEKQPDGSWKALVHIWN
jgi:uncharacterized protein (TIGR02246 family)